MIILFTKVVFLGSYCGGAVQLYLGNRTVIKTDLNMLLLIILNKQIRQKNTLVAEDSLIVVMQDPTP